MCKVPHKNHSDAFEINYLKMCSVHVRLKVYTYNTECLSYHVHFEWYTHTTQNVLVTMYTLNGVNIVLGSLVKWQLCKTGKRCLNTDLMLIWASPSGLEMLKC